ncbi:MAG: hemerythrin domain-containing protein [Acidimicrobiaceae bacterium]|nr:hemerythrin domain-containing protein [Acidimicrobiaceae bacterium]
MDIIKLLTDDHREVNQLFARFSRASKPETLEQLAKQVIHELSVHSAVEEEFVYPVLRSKLEEGSELADHAIDEHQEVERLLTDLEKDDPSRASFSRTMDKVIASVREHVSEEEGEVLPALREATNAEFRNKLGEVVERAKSSVPTHPHPMVPGTATAQLVAGPWAALIDRARDLVA